MRRTRDPRRTGCRSAFDPGAASTARGDERRLTMTGVVNAGVGALLAVAVVSRGAAMAQDGALSADSVLRELKAGNAHHAAHRYVHPHETLARQRELAKGQHPHA